MYNIFYRILIFIVYVSLTIIHSSSSEALLRTVDLSISIKKIIARNDTLWILSDSPFTEENKSGLFRLCLKDSTVDRLYTLPALDVLFDPFGNIFLVNPFGIVMKYDGVTWEGTGAVVWGDDLASVIDYCLSSAQALVTPDSTIWLGTWEEGLFSYKNNQWNNHVNTTDVGVTSLAYSTTDELWVGSFWGVFRYSMKSWTRFTTKDGLPPDKVIKLAVNDEKVWAATERAIVVFTNGKWESLPVNGTIETFGILSIASDSREYLWVGTNGGGVAIFDGISWVPFFETPELSDKHVSTITTDNNGKVYIGTSEGLIFINTFTPDGVNRTKDKGIDLLSIDGVFPNPFNSYVCINYSIFSDCNAFFIIYNIAGQIVERFKEAYYCEGKYTVVWNARNFSSGVYFCMLKSDQFTISRKLILIK